MRDTLWTRNFTLITCATGLGAVGGIASSFALSFLVFDETGSTLASALLIAMQFLPSSLLPLAVSPWMDRLPRKPFLVVGDAVNGLCYLLAGLYLRHYPFSYVGYLAFSLLLACLTSMDELAYKSLYPKLLTEGKEEKGLFPASVDFTADLHSMGQYIQQGERMLMETVVRFAPAEQQMIVPFDEVNGDGLNFLAGKTMDFINRQAMDGTLLAHVEGDVPNIILNLDENNARTMGQLIYFFEYACGLSGYLLGVNPFDQPGVEAYKKNMFALLGKPGYEEMGEELRKRLR